MGKRTGKTEKCDTIVGRSKRRSNMRLSGVARLSGPVSCHYKTWSNEHDSVRWPPRHYLTLSLPSLSLSFSITQEKRFFPSSSLSVFKFSSVFPLETSLPPPSMEVKFTTKFKGTKKFTTSQKILRKGEIMEEIRGDTALKKQKEARKGDFEVESKKRINEIE